MKSIRAVSAALVALGLGMTGPVSAMPQAPAVTQGEDLIVNVAVVDCHADVRRHFLPQYDSRVWHRHRQSNCRVILAEPEFEEERPRDCHRDVRRHYLPEYGRSVYHKHVGERCRIRVYNPHQGGGASRPDCVKLGPLLLCEN